MKKLRAALLIALGAVALASCAIIPTSAKPLPIPTALLKPLGLLGSSIPGTSGGRVRFITKPVYFVDATGHLAPSSRIVTAPAQLSAVLDQLIVGPTKIEGFAGYASDLPGNLIVLQATIKNKVAYIDVSESLSALGREKEVLAVGQLVFTAYYAGATEGIIISVAGVTQRSVLPDRSLVTKVTVKNCLTLLEP
jgi:Sporulation and spore germination